jgi:hypothetical protein
MQANQDSYSPCAELILNRATENALEEGDGMSRGDRKNALGLARPLDIRKAAPTVRLPE